MDGQTVLLVNVVLGVAAFFSSLTGFGFAIISTPFMVLFLPPQTVVPVVIISWIVLAIFLVRDCYMDMSLKRITPLVLTGVIGSPIGVYFLATVEAATMRLVIGGISLLAILLLTVKPGRPFQRERLALCGAGIISGLAAGACGMSGPPVVMLGLKQRWEYRSFRADLVGYFVGIYAVILFLYRHAGILDMNTLHISAMALPGILLGCMGGIRCKGKVSQAHFRKLAIGLVGAGGVMALISR